MIYRRTPSSSNHARTQRPMCSSPTNLATPTTLFFSSQYCFRNAYRNQGTVCPGFDSTLYMHTPPVFQVELEKDAWEYRWPCFGVRVSERWTIQS